MYYTCSPFSSFQKNSWCMVCDSAFVTITVTWKNQPPRRMGLFELLVLNFKPMTVWPFARQNTREVCRKKQAHSPHNQEANVNERDWSPPSLLRKSSQYPETTHWPLFLKFLPPSSSIRLRGAILFYMRIFRRHSKFKPWHKKCIISSYRIND